MEKYQIHELYKELTSDFEALRKIEIDNHNNFVNSIEFQFSFILNAIIFIISMLYLSSLGVSDRLSGILSVIISGLIMSGVYILHRIRAYIKGKRHALIQDSHYNLIRGLSRLDDIDTILSKTNTIRKLLLQTREYIKGGNNEFRNLIRKELDFIVLILRDLQSDLSIQLLAEQFSLESAKSQVSNHIHGTDELNQVSELQRQRLNKQIEQFEELQTVLVKV